MDRRTRRTGMTPGNGETVLEKINSEDVRAIIGMANISENERGAILWRGIRWQL